jgi:hypothetical protein
MNKLESKLPILCTGKSNSIKEMLNDYTDYIIDLNAQLKQQNYINIGYSERDYKFMNKYKIDKITHLTNLYKVKDISNTLIWLLK